MIGRRAVQRCKKMIRAGNDARSSVVAVGLAKKDKQKAGFCVCVGAHAKSNVLITIKVFHRLDSVAEIVLMLC